MEKISQFMCPVCGLHHSISNYDPEKLPLDIEAVLKVGLGRGKGTKVVDRYSLLWDDDVSPKIVKRVLTLCRFFLEQKLINQSDVKRSLGIVDAPSNGTISLKEYNKLREDLEALKVQAEMDRRRALVESDRANHLLETVNSQRVKLKDYNRLREDVEALRVKVEIESRIADRESIRASNLQVTVNSLHGKVRDLETQLSSSKSEKSRLGKELEELEARVENSNEVLDDVIGTIEERTEFMFDPSEDSRQVFIADVVPRLLEDLEALKADDENE